MILSHMDLDDTFKPELKKLLSIYHKMFEGYLVYVNKPPNWGGITIGPKGLISLIGGWRDLQFNEDWDLWARAAKIGVHPERGKNVLKRLKYRYIKWRERIRLGRRIFAENEHVTLSQKLIAFLAHVTSVFYPSFRDPFIESFNPWDKAYLEKTADV